MQVNMIPSALLGALVEAKVAPEPDGTRSSTRERRIKKDMPLKSNTKRVLIAY